MKTIKPHKLDPGHNFWGVFFFHISLKKQAKLYEKTYLNTHIGFLQQFINK